MVSQAEFKIDDVEGVARNGAPQKKKQHKLDGARPFFAIGMCLLFVGFTNVLNIRQAIKTGIVSGRWEKYDRRKTPMLYKMTFSGSVLAIVMCSLLGIVSIGAGIFLQLNSN